MLTLMCCMANALAQGNKVSLTCKDRPLPAALSDVERQCGYYKINYNYSDLSRHKVTATITGSSAPEAVSTLLKGLPYKATVNGKFIQIKKTDGNPQAIEATGRLLDQNGEPVIGAIVTVAGTDKRTVTDAEGRYSISGVGTDDVLQYSYVGMKTYKRKAGPKPVTIIMEDNTHALDDVVITGMQHMDKRLFTGSATTIDASEAKIDGIPDISRSLEGRAAGVSVQNVTGTFGTAPRIQVRGATSIYGNSQPLWVVDGVIQENVIEVDADELSSGNAETLLSSAIAGLNADDIESFQILRDGSATSIYGARHGRRDSDQHQARPLGQDLGKLHRRVHHQAQAQLQQLQHNELAGADVRIPGTAEERLPQPRRRGQRQPERSVRQAGRAGKLGRRAQHRPGPQPVAAPAGIQEHRLVRPAFLQQHHAEPLGEHQHRRREEPALRLGEPHERPGLVQAKPREEIHGQHQLHVHLLRQAEAPAHRQRLDARAESPRHAQLGGRPGQRRGVEGVRHKPLLLRAKHVARARPDEFYTRNNNPFNIFHELENNYIDLNTSEFKIQGMLTYKPVAGLELNVLGALKRTISSSEHNVTENSNQANAYRAMGNTIIRDSNPYLWTDPNDPYAVPVSVLPYGGIYDRNDYRMTSWDFRGTANYNKIFNRKHILNIFGGLEANSVERNATWMRAWGRIYEFGNIANYDPDMFDMLKSEGADYYTISSALERTVAFFGNATYSYKGRYIGNATLRYEGTNTLGANRKSRWLPTWNISGAWNAHEEEWFKRFMPTLSHFTLKGSYSLTADRGPYDISNSTAIINSLVGWRPVGDDQETTLAVTELGNSDLTYEKKHELSITADIGFMNNRINMELSWYDRRNFDLIGPITVQGVGGEIDKYGNIADMKSGGFELSLNTKNIKTADFEWSTTFLYSHQYTEVTNLKNTARVIDLVRGNGFALEGYPVRSIFSIPFNKLTNDGFPTFKVAGGEVTTDGINFQEYSDLSWLKYEGSTDPTDYGSLENTFKYKGFRLNVFIVYSFGNVVRLDPVFSNTYTDLDAMPREFNNRWSSSGEENRTTVPVIPSVRQNFLNPNLSIAYSAYNYSTERIAKGDFIRMKEISIDYTFPKEWLKPLKLENANLKLQATNLFLIYADKKLNGMDPEFYNTGGVASPMPKQYTLTLRLSF